MTKCDKFIQKAKETHGDKYDYSKVTLNNLGDKVTIICPEHGEFEQTATKHMRETGCPMCSRERTITGRRKDTDFFIHKAREVHGDKYDYSNVTYTKSIEPVTIICPEHGEFEQTPHMHLQEKGCPECGKTINKAPLSNSEFVDRCRTVHGDRYDYSKTEWGGIKQKVTIICPEHGEFEQLPYEHTTYQKGCPKCRLNERRNDASESFFVRAREVHGDKYDYSKSVYRGANVPMIIICPEHGEFEQSPSNHLHVRNFVGCAQCSHNKSNAESDIATFVQSLESNVVCNTRQIIPPLEIDIYLPDKNIGIEFCGLYWHSDIFKTKNYHRGKLEAAQQNGVRLIQIFEDEWGLSPEVVKQKLTMILGHNSSKVFARNCNVIEVSAKVANQLHREFHIQGSGSGSVHIGLEHNDEVIAALSLKRIPDGYDLTRFSSKIQVVGGFSKLLHFFKNNYTFNHIITFADRRWSDGNLYLKNGFKHVYNTQPNYFYILKGKRYSRIKFQKHKLSGQLETFNPRLTEAENMKNNGYSRIYDCGHMKFVLDSNA